ncbi:MAG: serine/threonine-protein kinase [Deltaproteobacteria bacterium]|jgi:serine/threonine protein kinase|nr:serine/threonine-protein kinase [Deltaproteobacteria bacterium]
MADKNNKIGKYSIEKKLATGGMGELYLASNTGKHGFKRKVVVKRLHQELNDDHIYREFFIREAILSGKFYHPNIVQVYHMDEDKEGLYMVMEYILGHDLMSIVRQSIRKKAFIPLHHALNIVMQIGEGLAYVHSLKDKKGKSLQLVHRDVTPSNIIVSMSGFAKLVDFGVAAIKGDENKPQGGIIPGKINYMAPELIKGKEPEARSDIFSLGIMLYELTVGKRLFKGNSEKVREIILNKPIPAPTVHKKDFDPELEKIILKSLDKDPDYRYQQALDMVLDLEKYIRTNSLPSSHLELSEYIKNLFRVSNIPHIEKLKNKVERDEIELDFDEDFLNDWSDEGALGAELPEEIPDMDDEEYFAIMADPKKAEKFFNTPEPEQENKTEKNTEADKKDTEYEVEENEENNNSDQNNEKAFPKQNKSKSEKKEVDSNDKIEKPNNDKSSNEHPKDDPLNKKNDSHLSSVVLIIILITIALLFFFYTQS